MAGVEWALAEEERDILSRTGGAHHLGAPFLSERGGRAVFCFRDMDHKPFRWRHEACGAMAGADEVDDALRALLTAMYDDTLVGGIHWSRGDVVLLDNHRWFHGRTGTDVREGAPTRHLKKVTVGPR